MKPIQYKQGSAVHNAKLNEDKVLKIRELFKEGVMIKDLATRFEISTSVINRVVNRRMWKHI